MTDVLAKINSCHEANQELITSIEDVKQVKTSTLSVNWKGAADAHGVFMPKVTEQKRDESSASFLADWKFGHVLRADFDDMFNDNLNWDSQTFEEVKKLNDDIPRVARKYKKLCCCEKAEEMWGEELGKYLENLTIIQTGLVDLKSEISGKESRLEEARGRISEVAKAFNDVARLLGSRPPPSFKGSAIGLSEAQRSQLVSWFSGEYVLVYRGSRDGMNASAFHQKADLKGATVTIIKCGSDVFGGFTKVSWGCASSNGVYIADPHACLFKLQRSSVPEMQIFPVRKESVKNAVWQNSSVGPVFGGGNYYDVQVFNSGSTCSINAGNNFQEVNNYSLTASSTNQLTINEIEVYAVKGGQLGRFDLKQRE
eukprot:Cvel_26436.t1-p1 / transcript=Cvel_26436.t1 / gene=Cvel_26436 / organism=Chromera_velia_CCMP2878 / gene_product=hypothetical protein / transcript_product=hypothetical protein / location=Cvel_scaffold3140:17622-18986(-) / protein_length=368 / sequence_SO=supercontig / SO=protein_coding / is_pseudo=false